MEVLFVKNKNWWAILAYLIAWFSPKTRCSHVVVYQNGRFYDFSFGGFRDYGADYFYKNYEIKHSYGIPTDQNIKKYINEFKDREYGKLQLLGYIFVDVFNMDNPFSNGSKLLVCNEFALNISAKVNDFFVKYIPYSDNIDIDRTFEIFEEFNEFIQEG